MHFPVSNPGVGQSLIADVMSRLVIELKWIACRIALVSIEKTDIRAIQSNLSQHFLGKVKAGPGVVMTIHHCHIALSCGGDLRSLGGRA